jgi:peptidoglycan/LPS O-acetylase OafA/YrhL
MMLLGVFVHAALVIPELMPVDAGTGSFFTVSYAIVHSFRMPAFFLISGFFAAYLLQSEGVRAFLVSRFKRIVSVLAVAAAIIASLLWQSGCTWCSPSQSRDYLSTALIYLWFLYYLVIISHLALVANQLAKQLPARMRETGRALAGALRLGPVAVGVVGLVLALVPGVIDSAGQIRIEMGWLPNIPLLVFFGAFFALGWVINRNAEALLRKVTTSAWVNFALAAGFGAASAWLFSIGSSWQPVVQVLAVTYSTFAVIGLFLRYLNAELAIVRYLADASYWVYLFHAPVMFVIIALGAGAGWSPLIVAVVSIASALAFTLVTYHYLVRSTIIGKWLSGRRRPRRGSKL